jgi:hypothetical protein
VRCERQTAAFGELIVECGTDTLPNAVSWRQRSFFLFCASVSNMIKKTGQRLLVDYLGTTGKVDAIKVRLNICPISKFLINESKTTIIRLGLEGYLEAHLTVVS